MLGAKIDVDVDEERNCDDCPNNGCILVKEEIVIEIFAKNEGKDREHQVKNGIGKGGSQNVHDEWPDAEFACFADEEEEKCNVDEGPDKKEDHKRLASDKIIEHFYS